MVRREIDEIFRQEGYRFLRVKPEETGVYYKYYQEGFHIVMVVDQEHGYSMTPEQHHIMTERITGSFYHPQRILTDFPDGFPVYHVEVLTVLVGDQSEPLRMLCAQCERVWAYLPGERQLLIYENQPGDFFGLREVFESLSLGNDDTGGGYATERKLSFREKMKNARYRQAIPSVTIGIVAVNVLVYLILESQGDTRNGLFIAEHGGMYPTFLLYDHQWWRLLTAGFLHFGAAHLVNNMVILYCMGSRMERAAGHIRFLVIYMLSLLGGSLLSYAVMLHTGEFAVSAGASGAVFGIIGGVLWIVLLCKGRLEDITTRGILIMLLLSVYFGFSSSGVDNWCHIGGAVTGFVATAILYRRKRQKD